MYEVKLFSNDSAARGRLVLANDKIGRRNLPVIATQTTASEIRQDVQMIIALFFIADTKKSTQYHICKAHDTDHLAVSQHRCT